jgi:GTP-binding protein
MRLPLVALVGRPNVGKSTLFNRIVGHRLAIVEDLPGTTRDRLYAPAEWAGSDFMLVDTGGLQGLSQGTQPPPTQALATTVEGIDERVRNQALVAITEADVIVLVVDALDGVTRGDEDVADLLRRSGKPIVLAVNKAEKQKAQYDAAEFWNLAVGEPHALTALHGRGSGDLLDEIVALLPVVQAGPPDESLGIAIVGRPNVGKSSLLNRLTGADRAVVSAIPGTTRDPVDTTVRWEGEEFVLIDTAGIRRRGRIEAGIERYSVLRAMLALDRAEVAVLVIDAVDGVTAQDAHIGGAVADAGVGAIIAVNKWDLVEKDHRTALEMERKFRAQLQFLDYAKVIFISALTGQRAVKLLPEAMAIHAERRKRIPTGELNRLVAELSARHAITRGGKPLKIRYATQVGVAPPRFVFFVNDVELVHFTYRRYIENQLRQRYGFEGTAIKLRFRQGDDEGRRTNKARRKAQGRA